MLLRALLGRVNIGNICLQTGYMTSTIMVPFHFLQVEESGTMQVEIADATKDDDKKISSVGCLPGACCSQVGDYNDIDRL